MKRGSSEDDILLSQLGPLRGESVSYTHLDVYKRQVKGCSLDSTLKTHFHRQKKFLLKMNDYGHYILIHVREVLENMKT